MDKATIGEYMLGKKLWRNSYFDRYLFWIIIAVELLMSFTFLGYIHIPPISITIAYLPVLAVGCLLGPEQTVMAAFVFGAASMYKASASYVMPADAVFSPFLSGAPVSSLLLSIGTRMLFGLVIGITFKYARNTRKPRLYIGLIAAIAPKIHSLIVYTAMGLLFPELGRDFHSALHWKLNDAFFVITCIVVIELLWAAYQSDFVQHIRMCIDQSDDNPYTARKMNLFFAAIELFLISMSAFATVYFAQRQSYMLEQHGIAVSERISSDLLLLQIQFLIASLALNVIIVILLIATYRYMSYKEYCIEMDVLTGVMGRRMFLYYCDKIQKSDRSDFVRTGWFLFVDADYFKAINDSLGHATGDVVLKEIAQHLQRAFGDGGKVGRLGGDEFAVMLEKPIPQQELEECLDQFLKDISHILPDRTVSCSIGAYQFVFPQNMKHLLEEADAILYKAKEKGRACYVIKPCGPDQLSSFPCS